MILKLLLTLSLDQGKKAPSIKIPTNGAPAAPLKAIDICVIQNPIYLQVVVLLLYSKKIARHLEKFFMLKIEIGLVFKTRKTELWNT